MIKRFFNYIEIKTKITSLFAFLMTLAYVFYIKKPVNWGLTSIFFASMFIFDLTTTAINNYIDTKTNHQTLAFKRRTALVIIYVMFAVSTALGLYLVTLTDLVVLVLGGLCFLCGTVYTFGPIPISRQPLGEILSGIFYGFFIPFILLYINLPKGTYVSYSLTWEAIGVYINIWPVMTVILLAVIPVCTTANIMLANNICDMERDITVKRYTLPYYIGKKMAIYLFAAIYYIAYVDMALLVIFGVLSPIFLITLPTIILVQKNIGDFFKKQDKATTFLVSIKNFVIIMGAASLMIFISGVAA